MRARLLAPAIVTATALCGCSAGAGRPAPRPSVVASASASTSASSAPATIPLGVVWHLAEYRLPGEPRVVVAYDATLTFEAARYHAVACNGYAGPFHIAGDRVDFQGGGASQMQCHGAEWDLEKAFLRLLGKARWRIEGTRLTLWAEDGATFLYESGDALAPGSGHTVVEGERRGRRYRVWTVGRGNEVVLRADALDLAGRGASANRTTANPHVDEYSRGVGARLGPREGVVAGFAPLGTVRMTYRPKRGPEVELALHTVPGVRWRVFAGVVRSGGDWWAMAAYDARGRTLAPFTGKRPEF